MKGNVKNKINLKKKIFREYLYILVSIIYFFICPVLADFMLGDNRGIDGIGNALAIGFLLNGILSILIFCFFIINPIRIIISYKSQLQEILSIKKRILYYILIILPTLYVITSIIYTLIIEHIL